MTRQGAQQEVMPDKSSVRGSAPNRLVARRPLATALIVGVVLFVGFVAGVAIWISRGDATTKLVSAEGPADADLALNVQVRSIDARSGELGLRLVVDPRGRGQAGFVDRAFRLIVPGDVGGQVTYVFEQGQVIRSLDIALDLSGGSLLQYPFDRYGSTLAVFALSGIKPDSGEALSMAVTAEASLTDFEVAGSFEDDQNGADGSALLALDVTRPPSTVAYSLWMMALMWGLAIAGLGVVLAYLRWNVEIPWWLFGYLVGVLFALPPLRNSLPGSPPSGGFVDYVAFYWAVALVGILLPLVIWLWIRHAHSATSEESETA